MAGQFDKFIKILGSSSRPDVYKGAPGNPDIVAPRPSVKGSDTDPNGGGKDTNITQADVNIAKGAREDLQARDISINRKNYGRNARKRLIANLNSTTMRLNESTGEAYDTEDVKPTPSGRVMPTRQANPKYLAADVQRQNEDLQSFTEADRARNNQSGEKDPTGEDAFNTGEKAKGSSLRSVNGVTYDLEEYKASLPNRNLANVPAPYDISEFEPKTTTSSTTSSTAAPAAPAAEAKEPTFLKVKKIRARRGGKVYGDKIIDNIERESEGPTTVEYGATLSEENKKSRFTEPLKSKIVDKPIYKRPDKVYVEGDIAGAAYEQVPNPNKPGYSVEGSKVASGYDDPNDLRSTTMREVQPEGPAAPAGTIKVKVVSPRTSAPYEKPTVTKPETAIPPIAMDTFGNLEDDKKQAERENKRIRESRTVPTRTTVLDQNTTPARPVRGQTPERQAVLGGIREERAAALAAEGKEMTTVAPEVMATAKRLGATSTYNLTEDYMNSTSFLAHPAVQDATIAHALGVQHTLGDPDNDHLARYYGGRPLEAQARREAAFKIVDRNRRGNPEKLAGEFALLRGMVHAGTGPSRTLNDIRSGKPNNVVVNGQSVTLPEGSSENRTVTHEKASKLTAALGSVAATPKAPLAGTNRVGVRSVGQSPEETTIREFSPAELRNKKRVPTIDDSKSKMGPVEKEVETDTSDIVDRLKVGKSDKDVADNS